MNWMAPESAFQLPFDSIFVPRAHAFDRDAAPAYPPGILFPMESTQAGDQAAGTLAKDQAFFFLLYGHREAIGNKK